MWEKIKFPNTKANEYSLDLRMFASNLANKLTIKEYTNISHDIYRLEYNAKSHSDLEILNSFIQDFSIHDDYAFYNGSNKNKSNIANTFKGVLEVIL